MDEPLSSTGGGGWMCFFMSKPQSTRCPRSPGQQASVRLLENCCFKGAVVPFWLLLEKNLHGLCLSQLRSRAGLTSSSAWMGPASTAASSATRSMTARTKVMSLAASMVSSVPRGGACGERGGSQTSVEVPRSAPHQCVSLGNLLEPPGLKNVQNESTYFRTTRFSEVGVVRLRIFELRVTRTRRFHVKHFLEFTTQQSRSWE